MDNSTGCTRSIPIPDGSEILNAIDANLAQAPSAIVGLQGMDVVEEERSRMFHAQVSAFRRIPRCR